MPHSNVEHSSAKTETPCKDGARKIAAALWMRKRFRINNVPVETEDIIQFLFEVEDLDSALACDVREALRQAEEPSRADLKNRIGKFLNKRKKTRREAICR